MGRLIQAVTSHPLPSLRTVGWATLAVIVATGIAVVADSVLSHSNLSLIFLIAVLHVAIRFGLWPSVYASVLSFLVYLFIFTAPYYAFHIESQDEVLSLILFLVVAITVGDLAARLKDRTVELEQKNEQLAEAYLQIEQELEAAQSLQQAILPQEFPLRAECTGHALLWPARHLAGDFYDVFELADGRLGVLIADVSGKGVAAAFFMGISRTVLRAAARESQSPGACLGRANDVLCRTNPTNLFVTVFYGILDPRDGCFFYANGGHTPPVLLHNGVNVPTLLEGTGSLPLGALEGILYPERSVRLEPGDAVLLYTDGVTEARNAAGEEFAEEGLIRAAGETQGLAPVTMAAHLTEAVRAFTGGGALADDLTCLVLCYVGTAAGE